MAIKQLPSTENSPVDLSLDFILDVDGKSRFDMSDNNGDMATTSIMNGWIINSLFINRRAPDDADIDGNDLDKLQGWWGDIHPRVENDKWGSLLWTLAREKITDQTLNDFKQFSEDGLAWMITDLIASEINVTVTRLTSRIGWIHLQIQIVRPNGNRELFRFNYAWDAQSLEIVT